MIFSAISFNLLSGNIITLYALKLGAGNILIGILSSFLYVSQLMPLLGRKLAPKTGMIRLMGGFWLLRYLLMIPLLFTPLAVLSGHIVCALGLCTLSVFLFNVSRGLGITVYNPIIGSLATAEERGAFFSRIALVYHLAAIVVNIAIALLLGKNASFLTYTAFIGCGIGSGIVSALILFRVPEPHNARLMLNTGPLFTSLSKAYQRKSFRRFIFAHLSVFFIIAMIGPFLIVFMKKVYHQPDSSIVYFIVIGSFGAIIMALASAFLLDRLGAKPLYFCYSLIIVLVMAISLTAPSAFGPFAFFIYASLIFFLFRFGESGLTNAGLVYFFSTITENERLDLGAVYQIAMGLSASIGSVLGGFLLDGIEYITRMGSTGVFRIYFGGLLAISLIIILLILRMDRQGAYSIKDAFSVIFSPRDWRVISILNRLEKSQNVVQERDAIKALGRSPSDLSVSELIERLNSPRFSVRAETLNALSGFPMNEEIADALIKEVTQHEFTTAFLAAKILGKKKVKRAIPVLRKALHSEDFYLSGKAMVALARLGDKKSIDVIESMVTRSSNPRIIIHGALSLELFQHLPSLKILIEKLQADLHPFVQDELILSIAGIIGMDAFFYPLYRAFLKQKSRAVALLCTAVDDAGKKQQQDDSFMETLKDIIGAGLDHTDCKKLSGLLHKIPAQKDTAAKYLYQALAYHPSPPRRLVFLIISFFVWCINDGGS
jgi:hypothetical protein